MEYTYLKLIMKVFEMNVYNDGGRDASGFTFEKNDCCVRALSIALGIEYATAHKQLKDFGRQDSKSTYNFVGFMQKHIPSLEFEHRTVNQSLGWSIKSFLKYHPTGTFILRIRHHVFAVINGIAYDTWNPKQGSHIMGYWKLA